MHEYALVESLLHRVEAEARAHGAVSVQRVALKIGELAAVERDLLITAFETFREGTMCARAQLDVTAVPARWVCPGCGRTVAAGEVLRCADCGRPARLEAGDEILLERLELEVPDV